MADFSCAELFAIKTKLPEIWKDSQVSADYEADIVPIQAIRENQTAIMTPLESASKDNMMTVEWISTCPNEVKDCDELENPCVIDGEEKDVVCKDYENDLCFYTEIKVRDDVFRTLSISRDEYLGREFNQALKDMDEKLAQIAVAKIDSFAGVNQLTEGQGTVSGTSTFIPAAYWTPNLFAYLSKVAVYNKMKNSFLFNGGNLWEQNWNARFDQLNDNMKDKFPKLNTFKQYFDLFWTDQILGQKKSFLITKGAIALANQARFPLIPEQFSNGANIIRYKVQSNNLPGIFYDVEYKTTCGASSINKKSAITHDWRFSFVGGIFLNPVGCNDERTGVLSFVCGDAGSGY